VNLTAGCAHGCLYCYTRGYRSHPGEGRILLYANTLRKLQEELPRKRSKPSSVYFSPASDLFQPVPEVLDLGYAVLKYLFQMRQRVSFLTKGVIPVAHMELLKRNASLVQAGIGLISLDEKLTHTFEPGAASPSIRLAQARALAEAGIPTQVRLDPILPGLTDSPDALDALCHAVADCDVRHVAASVLFLRPAVAGSLKRNTIDPQIRERLLGRFNWGERLRIHAERASVVALPEGERKAIFDRLLRIAERHGIAVHICACKNPDLASASCSIAGRWSGPGSEQASLF